MDQILQQKKSIFSFNTDISLAIFKPKKVIVEPMYFLFPLSS